MPINFSWVVEGRLAASGQPGAGSYFGGSLAQDLEILRSQGVGWIVSLTEQPLAGDITSVSDLKFVHLPVADMTPPGQDTIDQFLETVDQAQTQGWATLVHCRAGLGRTGTLLACYLARGGLTGDEAIWQVRQMRPGSIETAEQEMAVRTYAARCQAQQPQACRSVERPAGQ